MFQLRFLIEINELELIYGSRFAGVALARVNFANSEFDIDIEV